MNTWIRAGQPLVIAHRGYTRIAPENTLPAFEKAIALGADMIELDVNLTLDGELVIIHDYKLNRTTNGEGLVSEHTLAELKELDAGSHLSPEYIGTRIPTCKEVIELFRSAGIRACFEIKGGESKRAETIAEKLVELFTVYDAFHWACISSYFPTACLRAHQLAPHLMVTRERLPDDAPFDIGDALLQASELNSPVLLSDFHFLDKQNVALLHENDVAIWAWNPIQEHEIRQVISMGCDGIMGDDPALAVHLLQELEKTIG